MDEADDDVTGAGAGAGAGGRGRGSGGGVSGVSALPAGPRVSPPRPPDARRVPSGAPALPTRVRQASLARELREEPPPKTPDTAADPEEMRAIFGAFQRGRDLGRQGSETPTEPGAPAPAPRPAPRDHASAHADERMDTDDVR